MALTDVNINQWVPIAGLAVFVAAQIFGIVGATLKNKVMVLIYALLESVAFLLLLGVLIVFAIYLYGCQPDAPLYGPELCELFTDRTTTINNLILVCFVLVIGIFAIVFSWRLFRHLRRKSKFNSALIRHTISHRQTEPYTHIVRQSTRSHLNVNMLSSSSRAPLPGHVNKPSQGLSQRNVQPLHPVPTAYKGQLTVNAAEECEEMVPVSVNAQHVDNSSSSSEEHSQSQSQSRSQSHSNLIENEGSEESSEASSYEQSHSQSQSQANGAEETSVDVAPAVHLDHSDEESSEYESDNEGSNVSHTQSKEQEESSSADEDEWSHSEV